MRALGGARRSSGPSPPPWFRSGSCCSQDVPQCPVDSTWVMQMENQVGRCVSESAANGIAPPYPLRVTAGALRLKQAMHDELESSWHVWHRAPVPSLGLTPAALQESLHTWQVWESKSQLPCPHVPSENDFCLPLLWISAMDVGSASECINPIFKALCLCLVAPYCRLRSRANGPRSSAIFWVTCRSSGPRTARHAPTLSASGFCVWLDLPRHLAFWIWPASLWSLSACGCSIPSCRTTPLPSSRGGSACGSNCVYWRTGWRGSQR